jgi:hypothetical protein
VSFFHFDTSRRALVFPDAQTGKPVAIHIDRLREHWMVDEVGLRTLPRFEPPIIHGVRR